MRGKTLFDWSIVALAYERGYISLFRRIFPPSRDFTPGFKLGRQEKTMPTYEYECKKCNHQFEQFQSITAEPLKSCPKKGCRGRVRRLISAGAGLLFKGSGFYITDYRSDSYKKAEKAEKADSKDSSKKSEGAETKGKSATASTSKETAKSG